MTAPQTANPVSAFAAAIGRYFTVISVVPSLLLVAFLVVLAESGAWSREPDLGEGVRSLTQLGLGGTFAVILAALALGVVLHPLQFALVQFLEGYWGVSPFWKALRENRVRHHLRRRDALIWRLHREHASLSKIAADDDEQEALHFSEIMAATRLLSIYPESSPDVMPTRLGNVLRAAETKAGAAVDTTIILEFAPHLMMVAPREQVDYVNDQRTAVDLAIRTCLICIVGFAAAVLYLWPHKLWLLVALIPFGLAWLCYQGAVIAAREYGAALRMLVDFNRFALYERMRLPLPMTTAAERALIKRALRPLSAEPDDQALVRYRHSHQRPDERPVP